jgi:hypothetical protein
MWGNFVGTKNLILMKNLVTIILVLFSFNIFGQSSYSENMGTAPSTISIAAHEAANGFQLVGLTYSGTGDVRNTNASSGYAGASGLGNIFLTNTVGRDFIVTGFGANGSCTSYTLQFGVFKNINAENGSNFIIEYSTTGSSGPWTSAGTISLPTGSGTVTWHLRSVSGVPIGAKAFRFSNNSTSPQFRIDDLSITGVGAGCALPIELIAFKSIISTNNIKMTWQTATEINNAYFYIERSADGARYEAIGQVPGAGTSTVINTYTYTDEQPLSGVNYYRLRQVDFDGQYAYSPVVSVVFGSTDARLLIAPSPASDDVTVQLTQPTAEPISWEVYDQGGRMVLQGTAASEIEQFGFNVGALAEGFYILQVTNGREVMTERFQKR